MKTKTLLTSFAIASLALIVACKKSNTTTASTSTTPPSNPIVIPVQTTVQTTIAMSGATSFAILAGSDITSTGATNITGDLGLSPGTSIGGFPPGILTGTQHINDVIANQAKLDLTAAYN
ncbi:MAG TPA: ice-binding family protein, partial [Bacteroidia bacterium]|nr:ice-binding family protein [Bacteroidia bacterium]